MMHINNKVKEHCGSILTRIAWEINGKGQNCYFVFWNWVDLQQIFHQLLKSWTLDILSFFFRIRSDAVIDPWLSSFWEKVYMLNPTLAEVSPLSDDEP